MNKGYVIIITTKGYSSYNVIDIDNIIDNGESYNILGDNYDIYMDKKYCDIDYSTMSVRYNDGELKVLITPGV